MRSILLLGIGVVLIVLDFVTKCYAKSFKEPFFLIGDFLYLTHVTNPGIAFSLPLTGNPLKIITIFFIFVILWYYRNHEYQKKSLIIDASFLLILS